MKRLILRFAVAAAAAVTVVAAAAPLASATARSGTLQVNKECSHYDLGAGSFCTITSSNLSAVKPGSKVVYASAAGVPTPGVLDSDLVIEGPGHNSAFGHVVLDLATLTGEVTLSGGTGPFARFHAGPIAVACPDFPACTWEGPYRFGPDDD